MGIADDADDAEDPTTTPPTPALLEPKNTVPFDSFKAAGAVMAGIIVAGWAFDDEGKEED